MLALALSACGKRADDRAADDLSGVNGIAAAEPAPNEGAKPPENLAEPATGPAPDEPAATTIPTALHGRWGLVTGDCTSTRGDAKGLVTITAAEVRFYESVARPSKIVERTGSTIRGEFDLTGEGMEWTNSMIWSANGNKLTRVDSEDDSRLVYTRC